jgi:hypothetical protein
MRKPNNNIAIDVDQSPGHSIAGSKKCFLPENARESMVVSLSDAAAGTAQKFLLVESNEVFLKFGQSQKLRTFPAESYAYSGMGSFVLPDMVAFDCSLGFG